MVHLLLAVIYAAFISLGLPDSLLGAVWPTMYGQFGVPVSYAGIVSMIVAAGTIASSLMSDRLTHRLGVGKVTAISVATTAAALFGFSISGSFWQLCLWAVPYGLGAGSVDAALNNYVALHFTSRHMSWLHCMWGVGASLGPYIIGLVLAGGAPWNRGYRVISLLQVCLSAVLFLSLPLWRSAKQEGDGSSGGEAVVLTLREILRVSGAKNVMLTMFCYCSLEQTAILWASSYLVLCKGISAQTAAAFASLFCVGVTVGRGISGFLTLRLNDCQMVRLGMCVIALGVAAMLLPLAEEVTLAGLVLAGLGCAPIYPSVIHATPEHFGADRSQAVIGVEMASAYVGICLMPPLFGLMANHVTPALFPLYLLALLLLMALAHEGLQYRTK